MKRRWFIGNRLTPEGSWQPAVLEAPTPEYRRMLERDLGRRVYRTQRAAEAALVREVR